MGWDCGLCGRGRGDCECTPADHAASNQADTIAEMAETLGEIRDLLKAQADRQVESSSNHPILDFLNEGDLASEGVTIVNQNRATAEARKPLQGRRVLKIDGVPVKTLKNGDGRPLTELVDGVLNGDGDG